MTDDWLLPYEQWYAMTKEQQRQHRISVRAYFLAEQRKKDGTPGTPDDDWHAAEYEEDRRVEVREVFGKARDTKDRNEKIRFLVIYHISETLKLRPADINDETALSADKSIRRDLGQSLGWQIINGIFQIPDDVVTVGALTKALEKPLPVVYQRRVAYL